MQAGGRFTKASTALPTKRPALLRERAFRRSDQKSICALILKNRAAMIDNGLAYVVP
jgi:hypothetical protein